MSDEYMKIRSGRINVNIFNNVQVNYYETYTPINQLSNTQFLDARTILIKPYDKTLVKEMVNALNAANLGANVLGEVDYVKVQFAPVTEENRRSNVKIAKEILENAKQKVRSVREDTKNI
jgi:ribosome recycling factor